MRRTNSFLFSLVAILLMLSACAAPAATPGGSTAAGGSASTLECTDAIGCVTVAPDEPIRIAYMLTISGATASLGDDSRGAIQIAIDDQGQLLGHDIDLVGEDSGCSAEGGQTAAQKVAADKSIVGVIGTSCSSAAAAALPTLSQAGLVLISPSNTAPSLTNDDKANGGLWQPGYYRTAHNDLFQGRVAAEYAYNQLNARKLATIHDGSPYAQGLQAVAVDVFKQLGGEITFQGAINVGDTDMRPILTEVASNPPDILYYPIFQPEGNLITAQSKEIKGLENTKLMGADGLFASDLAKNTGPAVVGMYLTGPYVAADDAYNGFLAKWDKKFGGVPPSGFHAHAYDATNMLFAAIQQATQKGDDGTLLIGRQAVRDALSATKDYKGLTGNLTCGPTGDCATGEALAVFQLGEPQLTDGAWPPPVVWRPGQTK